jgi:hypothetical protein
MTLNVAADKQRFATKILMFGEEYLLQSLVCPPVSGQAIPDQRLRSSFDFVLFLAIGFRLWLDCFRCDLRISTSMTGITSVMLKDRKDSGFEFSAEFAAFPAHSGCRVSGLAL